MSLLNKIRRRVTKLRGIGEGFSADGFENREVLRRDYQILAESLLTELEFQSIFDIGCANGFLLQAFLDAGKNARGIELSPDVRSVLTDELNAVVDVGDFRKAAGKWDLVCCVEVAEHLPPKRSEDLVKKISDLATRCIYFTAAKPGQEGHGHINCRPASDWINWFSENGWEPREEKTKAIRERLDQLPNALAHRELIHLLAR